MHSTEHEWEVIEKIPEFDDVNIYEVWVDGSTRKVRRYGNREQSCITPGTLVFQDCTHPMQNVICGDDLVQGWRLASDQRLAASPPLYGRLLSDNQAAYFYSSLTAAHPQARPGLP